MTFPGPLHTPPAPAGQDDREDPTGSTGTEHPMTAISAVPDQVDEDLASTPQTKEEAQFLATFAAGFHGEHWVTGPQEQARRDARVRGRAQRKARRATRRGR